MVWYQDEENHGWTDNFRILIGLGSPAIIVERCLLILYRVAKYKEKTGLCNALDGIRNEDSARNVR